MGMPVPVPTNPAQVGEQGRGQVQEEVGLSIPCSLTLEQFADSNFPALTIKGLEVREDAIVLNEGRQTVLA
jgi:hypothetical protein